MLQDFYLNILLPNLPRFIQEFDVDVVIRSLPFLLKEGLVFSFKLTLFATIGGVLLGTLLALARLSNIPGLTHAAKIYINFVRSVPLLLVIFWFYFLVPYIGAWIIGSQTPIQVGPFWSCLITFIMFEAAYFAEIVRAGIQSLPRGQTYAGYALGLTYSQVTYKIILPQAFRNMTPILLTQIIVLFQDVSLVSVLGVVDFMGAASKIAQRDFRLVEMYLFAALIYFVICFVASRLVKLLQNRIAIIR